MKKIFEIECDNELSGEAIAHIIKALETSRIKVTELPEKNHEHYYPDCSGVKERAKKRKPQPIEYCKCGYGVSDSHSEGMPQESITCGGCHKLMFKPKPKIEKLLPLPSDFKRITTSLEDKINEIIEWINHEGK